MTLTVTDNAGATGTATGTVSVAAAPTIPAAPSGASASSNGRKITVVWSDNASNESGFYVYREKWNATRRVWTSKTLVATKAANATSHADSPSSGTYRYSIVAFNSAGQSAAAVTNSVKR